MALSPSDAPLLRLSLVAGCALALWLLELVPPFVPTLLLAAGTPLALSHAGAGFQLSAVLQHAMDPVLALFFGGFALSAAASRHGLDRALAASVLAWSKGRWGALVALTLVTTAFLSMWMSNIAAAAMMLACLRGVIHDVPEANQRKALLLSLALGANFGGMATPVGTGPNGIAIAHLSGRADLSFGDWMVLALPLTLLLLLVSFFWVRRLYPYAPTGAIAVPERPAVSRDGRKVLVLFVLTGLVWASEPFHGVPSAAVALVCATLLFLLGLLRRDDLARIDWSTLMLIAGGILLGRLFEVGGMNALLGESIRANADGVSASAQRTGWVFASALLSAISSNTATATVLIPLASSLDPSPALPVLIALGASLGIPFVISTPPNAMVRSEGVTGRDLFVTGFPLMVLGVVLVGATGSAVLGALGLE